VPRHRRPARAGVDDGVRDEMREVRHHLRQVVAGDGEARAPVADAPVAVAAAVGSRSGRRRVAASRTGTTSWAKRPQRSCEHRPEGSSERSPGATPGAGRGVRLQPRTPVQDPGARPQRRKPERNKPPLSVRAFPRRGSAGALSSSGSGLRPGVAVNPVQRTLVLRTWWCSGSGSDSGPFSGPPRPAVPDPAVRGRSTRPDTEGCW
jgi:hypothetical protein